MGHLFPCSRFETQASWVFGIMVSSRPDGRPRSGCRRHWTRSSKPRLPVATPVDPPIGPRSLWAGTTRARAGTRCSDRRRRARAAHGVMEYLDRLGDELLRAASEAAELAIASMGISFTVYSEKGNIDRAWPFDVIPRVIDDPRVETRSPTA